MARSTRQAAQGPTSTNAAIAFAPPPEAADAARCARLGLVVATADATTWTLRRTETGALELRAPAAAGALRLSLDARSGPLARRLAQARRDQPLPRALGMHRRAEPPHVFDATAGLGRDALLLARLGCRITACERVPVLAVLLDDLVLRAGCADRVQVLGGDAAATLAALPAAAVDAVYLDPMFPQHGRAQVKQDMQVCRLLAGPPDDPTALVRAAFAAARERVVVKRHPHEAPLCGEPSFRVPGERVRFDVYLSPGGSPDT
ncbi:MAG: class I SAM-dependent methyltransferase [Planctomycetota bacterium]